MDEYKTISYKIPQTTEEFKEFHQFYLFKRWQVDKLEEVVNEKRQYFEERCNHVWIRDSDNRDERSRWKCTKCTKCR